MHRAWRGPGGIGLAHKNEMRRDQHHLDRRLDPVFEATIQAALRIHLQQRRQVGIGDRAAIGVARQPRKDGAGAGRFR